MHSVMDNKNKTKQDRVEELEHKIYYVESACDVYKETNRYLYQTNAIYLEKLKKKLEDLKES